MFVETFNRLKNWLTGPPPVIVKMDPYAKLRDFCLGREPSTHWIQVASSREACPVFPEDSCGYQPVDQNYAPCRREANHEGPCGHAFRLGIFDPDSELCDLAAAQESLASTEPSFSLDQFRQRHGLAFVDEIDREEDVLGFFPGDQ